jgi:hypothetical protein
MADDKDQKNKKWSAMKYIVVGLVVLLVVGATGWFVYSNMYSNTSTVSFKTPPTDSITLTAKKI